MNTNIFYVTISSSSSSSEMFKEAAFKSLFADVISIFLNVHRDAKLMTSEHYRTKTNRNISLFLEQIKSLRKTVFVKGPKLQRQSAVLRLAVGHCRKILLKIV